MIHFWAPAETASADDVLAWDPDAEPGRYATGFGHSMLELCVRLARAGVDVSIGEQVPPSTELVVVFPKTVYQHGRLRSLLRAGRRAGGRFAVIRSDTPFSWRFPVRPVVEFMPNRLAVERPWQRWVPPLPQRGLVPRDADRCGRIRSVAFKGYAETLPAVLAGRGWADALADRGIEWLPDVDTEGDGAGQRWHDFAAVDAVLCVRALRTATNTARKPATRLINAWAAGCVPLAEPDRAYVELGSEGADVFFVETPLAALPVIDRLNGDPEDLARVEQLIAERGLEYGTAATLERWRFELVEAAMSPVARRKSLQTTRVLSGRAMVDIRGLLGPARRLVGLGRRCAAAWRRRVLRSGRTVGSAL